MDAIPPTKGALTEHAKRAAYQAGYVWGQSLVLSPALPSPSDWGWVMKEGLGWSPYWAKLPQASAAVQTILKCGCKKICATRCKCSKAELLCTSLCSCGGDCK